MTPEQIMELVDAHASNAYKEESYDKLRTAIEELAADAARYQWIKAQKDLSLTTDGGIWTRDGIEFRSSHYMASNGTRWGAYETLDQLIDAAMEKQHET